MDYDQYIYRENGKQIFLYDLFIEQVRDKVDLHLKNILQQMRHMDLIRGTYSELSKNRHIIGLFFTLENFGMSRFYTLKTCNAEKEKYKSLTTCNRNYVIEPIRKMTFCI